MGEHVTRKIGGALAARRHWCRPDEFIRLAVGASLKSSRFDVGGVPWYGFTDGQVAAGRGERVIDAVDSVSSLVQLDDAGASPPPVVYYGPHPQVEIMRALYAANPDAVLTWVLTSQRFVLQETPLERKETGESDSLLGKARKLGAGVRDFSRDVVDIFTDKKFGDYAPGVPVPLADVAVRAEFPAQRIRMITQARRHLPVDYSPRRVSTLRIELDDESGVDVITDSEENCARLHAMAFGQQ
ncbi:MAG TPA: hypothetical protein VIL71_07275 [Spirillospora sp.]